MTCIFINMIATLLNLEVVNPKRQSERGLINLTGETLPLHVLYSLYLINGFLINMTSTLSNLEDVNPKRQSEWELINLMGESLPLQVFIPCIV